ncbi:ribonuclease J, partial [Campylobacter jejuni]|nr:ribonuclease J [Campylobacter jejuni]
NSNSKNNKRYKYRNRRKKLADSISENSQNSTHEFSNNEKINTKKNSTNTQPLEGENVEKPSEKKKKRNRNLPSKLTGNEDWQIALA